MAPPKKKASVADDGNQAANELPSAEKIARLLALIATRDMSTDVAAMKLLGVGFTPREIAGLLGVGDNYVHVVKNRRKKAGKHTQEKTWHGTNQSRTATADRRHARHLCKERVSTD